MPEVDIKGDRFILLTLDQRDAIIRELSKKGLTLRKIASIMGGMDFQRVHQIVEKSHGQAENKEKNQIT